MELIKKCLIVIFVISTIVVVSSVATLYAAQKGYFDFLQIGRNGFGGPAENQGLLVDGVITLAHGMTSKVATPSGPEYLFIYFDANKRSLCVKFSNGEIREIAHE